MTDTTVPLPILHHSPTSVCSQKVRLVLAALHVDYESVLLNLARGDQFETNYRRLNPSATVPTYEDQRSVFRDSNPIIWHLIASNSDSELAKSTRDAETECTYWLDRSLVFHQAIHALTYAMVNRPSLVSLTREELDTRLRRMPDRLKAQRLAAIVAEGIGSAPVIEACETIAAILPQLEAALEKSRFLATDLPTVADYAILPFIVRLDLLGQAILWEQRLPLLARWLEALEHSEPFEEAIHRYHTPARMKKFAELEPDVSQEITRHCLRRMT